jgi:diaminopimelate epimerase
MHGLGNDFIVIENLDCSLKKLDKLAIKLCDRHTGIGADGILIVEASQIADIKMRIINSDGSEPNMCGNGIRCFAKYVYEKEIVDKKNINIETLAGIMVSELKVDNNNVMSTKINMGIPEFEKKLIPFKGNENNLNYSIILGNKTYQATTLLMGIPHTIIYVNKIDDEEIVEYGKKIEKLSYFPHGTNVNFVKIIDENSLELKTWER